MRTAEDLIIELDENAKGYAVAALVIGFEGSTIFVMADDPNRFELLNQAVTLGGEPVGWYRCSLGRLEMGLLQEYEDESWAYEYLKALRDDIERRLRKPGAE